MQDQETDLCIVGGGPAGMMAGLLFARAGVRVTVLEKHADFLRDFRGDTVHPSTLRIFHELGLLEQLLERPHDKVPNIGAYVGAMHFEIADLSRFDRRWNFIAMMPQWEFLDFVADEARRYPGFSLVTEAEAHDLTIVGGRVTGVRYRHGGEERAIRAKLVIASDGRRSVLREAAGFAVRSLGAPMDIFWFRLPKAKTAENDTTGIFAAGRIFVLIDRGDYWQCAYVIAKGEAEAVKAKGLEALKTDVLRIAPMLEASQLDALRSLDDLKLLSVALDRLERWDRPGLVVIGDAAHAMSPIGGVGINVAIQDAVAAANILAGPMAAGRDVDPLLGRVRKRRLPAVRAVQAMQKTAQDRIISSLLARQGGTLTPPAVLRLLGRYPVLRMIPAAFIGFGVRPEHVRSPAR